MKFSYSMNGLTNLDFFSAIDEVEKAHYEGIELFFDEHNFNPYKLRHADLDRIKRYFKNKHVIPIAISTATPCFLSEIPHEPSLLSLNDIEKQKRINLIKKGIEIAKELDIPIVSFQSGYTREEHVEYSKIDIQKKLVEGIKECLMYCGNITLVIEPEPGMYIESLKDAIELINLVGSKNFKLHLDICHAYCSELDFIPSIIRSLPYTAYMHLADIKEGYNLEFIICYNSQQLKELDTSFKGYLIYEPKNDLFIFTDKTNYILFSSKELNSNVKEFIDTLIPNKSYYTVFLNNLISFQNQKIELENKVYLDSIGGVSYEILKKAEPILSYLRTQKNKESDIYINKPVCNTIKGKVHYHEVPGDGEINFKSLINALIKNNYKNFITVELYNHSDVWSKTLPWARKYLISLIENQNKVNQKC